ncbi:hypothetical protein HN51_035899 [Arachis hypogaea]|uniref:uncharacterized protein LOC107630337 n=1 Tax=Arachis ipaensis TaxID=130454 RepID=UPI0007AFA53E|nr:uncharacterized protein LOC107630337 [Arachis ipaensis]QHO01133.1 uncharacterized protein DS421_13g412380 [Arachis hypogaea]
MLSEIVAPRLSFSLDDSEEKDVPRKDTLLLDSNEDEFEFSRNNSIDYESSCCADEVFSNGVMITEKEKSSRSRKHMRYMKLPPLPSSPTSKNKKLEEKRSESKSSFWGFGRSKSLNNCDRKKKLMCSLSPLMLPRSKSTGSASVPVPKSKQQSQSRSVMMNMYPPRSSSSSYANNGHRVSPVLNVPTPVSLFGLASFWRLGNANKLRKTTKN